MIVAHLTRSLRETFPARASEWALGAVLFNWALVLSGNDGLFATQPSYAGLALLMSQEAWAWSCLLVGGGRLVILAVNGAWRRSPHARAAAAFLSCFFWFELSAGFLQAGTFGTALAVYPVLFLLDAYNAIRAMGEAGLSDHLHRRTARHGPDT